MKQINEASASAYNIIGVATKEWTNYIVNQINNNDNNHLYYLQLQYHHYNQLQIIEQQIKNQMN